MKPPAANEGIDVEMPLCAAFLLIYSYGKMRSRPQHFSPNASTASGATGGISYTSISRERGKLAV